MSYVYIPYAKWCCLLHHVQVCDRNGRTRQIEGDSKYKYGTANISETLGSVVVGPIIQSW